jgi:hypothetical protein
MQPPELLEAIASFIPLPRDLLSLALTSKALNALIIPEHLEFREVSCDPYRTALWTALAELPLLAGRIRSLSLQMEPIPLHSSAEVVVPQSVAAPNGGAVRGLPSANWAGERTNQSAEPLCAAISQMHGLTRFCFDHRGNSRLQTIGSLFDTVRQHCLCLRELELELQYEYEGPFDSIIDAVSRSPRLSSFASVPNLSTQISEFTNLTRVSITLRSASTKPASHTHLEKVFSMLNRCPQLEHLRIGREDRGPLPDVSKFLADTTWPRLMSLIVEGDLYFYESTTVTTFLSRHPQLEVLELCEFVELPALPNLRWVSVPGFLEEISTVTAALLPSLQYVALSATVMTAGTAKISSIFPALRGTTVSCRTASGLKTLVQAVPQLERLSFGLCSPWNAERRLTKRVACLVSASRIHGTLF